MRHDLQAARRFRFLAPDVFTGGAETAGGTSPSVTCGSGSPPTVNGPLGAPAGFYMRGRMTDHRSMDVIALSGGEMTASGSLVGQKGGIIHRVYPSVNAASGSSRTDRCIFSLAIKYCPLVVLFFLPAFLPFISSVRL